MTEKEALMAVLDGKKVIKDNWGDGIYMYFRDGKLKKVNGGSEDWLLSGDTENDYYIVDEIILTDKERDYLGAVIAPFRGRVNYITKVQLSEDACYVHIVLNWESLSLPFDSNKWFTNMENEKKYTLGELGL